ncbi:MAG: hypothetical protein O2786_07490 [archaeon]|nr:hypothetical protein [archaeon]
MAGSGVIWKGLSIVVRKTELECLNAEYDIVIDGSNLINHSEKGVTKLIPSRLIKAIRKVELLGYTPLTCIDRSTYSQAKKQKKPLEGSIEDFVKLIDEEGIRFMNRDDEMIDHALQRGALILTNDRFRKWKDGTEETKFEIDWDMVDEKLVQWWFEDEFFMPELLKKPPQSSNPAGTLPNNRVKKLANSNSNENPQRKKRGVFIKVLDLIFDNKEKVAKTPKKAKVQQKSQAKAKSQAKPHQNKSKPQQRKANPQTQKPKQAKPQQKKAKANPQAQKDVLQEKKSNPPSKKSLQAKPPQKKPQPSSKKSTKSNQVKNTSSEINDFKSKILEILPDRKISISGLATIINKQMVAAGIEKNPTTEFLKQYKLPKGLKKAINTHMSDEVIITGTGTKFFIEKKSKADEKA